MPIPTILRGEDSTARGRPISINLPEGDYAGLTVRFNLLGVMRDFPSPASGVPLVVRLSADETARFPLGTHFAAISVTNADGIGYVLTNTQRIRVTDTPEEAGLGDNAVSVTALEVAQTISLAVAGINDEPTSPDALRAAFRELLRSLRSIASALAVAAVLTLLGGTASADTIEVQTARSGGIPFDAPVVTNVTITPAPPPDIQGAVTQTVTKAYVESLGVSEVDPAFAAWLATNPPVVIDERDPVLQTWAATNTISAQIAGAGPGNYETVSNRAMSALQSFTETDPYVPAWAKEAQKPTYGYDEIEGTPDLDMYATTGALASAISSIDFPEEVDPIFTAWKPKREYHADSWTNIVWKNVYSNGWVFLVPYSNNLGDAE